MEHEVNARLKWVRMYLETGDIMLTCRRCGISEPTLRKWVQRYVADGPEGLQSYSRKPHHSPGKKVFEKQEEWILELRRTRNMGARRIQHELKRLHDLKLSLATIQKVLMKHNVRPLKRHRRSRPQRYERPMPGNRIQVDTIKIRPGLYQYTAIDDCTRYLMMGLYTRRTAKNSIDFFDMVKNGMLFPVKRFQTDRGTEFTAYSVQEALWFWRVKWRPIPPGMPHINGKVERVQQTVLVEFWATADLTDEDLGMKLLDWQIHYNRERIHGAIGMTPLDRVNQLYDRGVVPGWEEVDEQFVAVQEFLWLRSKGVEISVH